LKKNGLGWVMGVLFILGTTIAIGKGMLGFWRESLIASAFAIVGLLGVRKIIIKMIWSKEE